MNTYRKLWDSAVENPQEGFIKILKPLSHSETTQKLLIEMSKTVSSAHIKEYTLKPLSVEHEDYDQGKPKTTDALMFSLTGKHKDLFNKDREIKYVLIVGDPKINNKAPHDLVDFSNFGYLRFGWEHEPGCTLWGEHDLSIWTNDEYKLEDERDKAIIDQLLDYNECLIENKNYQWVVRHDDGKQISIVTSLLDRVDFDEEHRINNQLNQIDLIKDLKLGEIYLRLIAAMFYNLSPRKSLQDEKIFNT